MPPLRLALATDAAHPRLTRDDRLLLPALDALGVQAIPCVWDDRTVDWSTFRGVVIRSCWDYHLRLPEFERWLLALEHAAVPIRNPAAIVRWNARKHYLAELAQRGHEVVPTILVQADNDVTLRALLRREGWSDAVLKPVISASAHDTWRVKAADADGSGEARLRAMRARGDVLVQPFVPEITDEGEWSLVHFDGRFSHAVRKRPGAGDFRVQAEHGGSADPAEAPREAVSAAGRLLADVAPGCVYARVDGCMTAHGWRLMELELVEPSLFLESAPGAAGRFALAIASAFGAITTAG